MDNVILDTWHYFENRWVHIYQVEKDRVLYLYNNGELVKKETQEHAPYHPAFFKYICAEEDI